MHDSSPGSFIDVFRRMFIDKYSNCWMITRVSIFSFSTLPSHRLSAHRVQRLAAMNPVTHKIFNNLRLGLNYLSSVANYVPPCLSSPNAISANSH